jgi:hypothetical protein
VQLKESSEEKDRKRRSIKRRERHEHEHDREHSFLFSFIPAHALTLVPAFPFHLSFIPIPKARAIARINHDQP